jgi:CRISPR-associated protein Cas2
VIDPRYLIVFFDIPVTSPKERRIANQFRAFLKNNGYEMLQYSVYTRVVGTVSARDTQLRRLSKASPAIGSVECIELTAAQYEARHRYGGSAKKQNETQQLVSSSERILML